jgi:hypothetical protein
MKRLAIGAFAASAARCANACARTSSCIR